jgi:hypothetical protein
MSALRDLQAGFAAAVFEEDDGRFAAEVRNGRFPGERLLQIYRHNSFANLTRALEAVYPVVARLVGDGFFRYAADRYIRQHPSTSGNLHDFGDRLAAFLEAFEPAATLPYLPDVARLEWAWHGAFHAAGQGTLSPEQLAAVPVTLQDRLIFALHPSTHLLVSDYPILAIWQANQPDADEQEIDLAAGGVRLLVLRRGLDVEFKTLGFGEYQLLRACADGRRFAAACAMALAAEPDLDLPGVLQQHVLLGTIASFRIEPPDQPALPPGTTP